MAAPRELSLEAIRIYMLENGGKVTNHDLVKHFKRFLTNPETRDEARNQFKEYVNTLATIRNEDGEKCLVLKRRFRPAGDVVGSSSVGSPGPFVHSPGAFPPPRPVSPSISLSSSCSVPSLLSMSSESLSTPPSSRQPPPYRPPPLPVSPSGGPPPTPPPPTAPPRRRSSDRLLAEAAAAMGTTPPPPQGFATDGVKRPKTMGAEKPPSTVTTTPTSPTTPMSPSPVLGGGGGAVASHAPTPADAAVSVKERTQRFQRLASEGDLLRPAAPAPSFGSHRSRTTADDDSGDAVSVTSLDGRAREWLVRAAQADHQRLTKLAAEDPRLPRLRDPSSGYTALHWGAKHGNEHVIKLVAGTYGADVNVRSHGGYTPAHIAMQFNHENIFNLLVKVYGADPNLRDWSGKKPRQYQASHDTAVSADTFRKKDLGFLRIGSLNMRVKRTTEAFSNFLGVGSSSEKIHKTWGSADNIQQVDRHTMPPPKVAPVKKRGSRRGGQDYSGSHSTPSTPPSHTRTSHDSDSDTACGFGSDWQVATT